MCQTCGCSLDHHDHSTAIDVFTDLLTANNQQAQHNRAHFDEQGVLAINIMSAPGSGKTALLEATIAALKNEFQIAVIEGDLETENDAERIRAQGVPAIQIMTGTACHLDAHAIHHALHELALAPLDILFIENVGNLVCPASFDLGHHLNVILLSVTEGDDKPAKYPVMFRTADAVVLSKMDLLPFLDDFSPAHAEQYIRRLANPAPIFSLSAKTQQGFTAWLEWLRSHVV
jgi:hydrogenase nickel incorporation protein HypB